MADERIRRLNRESDAGREPDSAVRLAAELRRSGRVDEAFELLHRLRHVPAACDELENLYPRSRHGALLAHAPVPAIARTPRIVWSQPVTALGLEVPLTLPDVRVTGRAFFALSALRCAVVDPADGRLLACVHRGPLVDPEPSSSDWDVFGSRLLSVDARIEAHDVLNGSKRTVASPEGLGFTVDSDERGLVCVSADAISYFEFAGPRDLSLRWRIAGKGYDPTLAKVSSAIFLSKRCDLTLAERTVMYRSGFKVQPTHVLDRGTGKVLWTDPQSHWARADEAGVVVSHSASERYYDWSGKVQWERPRLGLLALAPSYVVARVLSDGPRSNPPIVIDRSSGRTIATLPYEYREHSVFAVERAFYCYGLDRGSQAGAGAGVIAAFSSDTGEQLWRLVVAPDHMPLSVAALPRRLYCLSDTHLYALE